MTKKRSLILIAALTVALAALILIWRTRTKPAAPQPVQLSMSEDVTCVSVTVYKTYSYESPEKLAQLRAAWNALEPETVDWWERDKLTGWPGNFVCTVTIDSGGREEEYQLDEPCIRLPDGTWCRVETERYCALEKLLRRLPADDPAGECVYTGGGLAG